MTLIDTRPVIKDIPQKTISQQRIHDDFLTICSQFPNAIAVQQADTVWRYFQIEQLSRQLAKHLIEQTSGDNPFIVIYGKRSAALIISLLACSRAGFSFAVLDAAYPKEKIITMTGIIAPALIIGIDTEPAQLDALFHAYLPINRLSVNLTHLQAETDNSPLPPLVTTDNSIAYLLFTSGTTGLPKCIKTGHAPLVHFIQFYKRTFQPNAQHRFCLLSGLSHDPVLRDIFVPLSIGAQLHIPDNESITAPVKLFTWFKNSQITHAHTTPQMIRLLAAGANNETLPHLTQLFSGGDVLRAQHINELTRIAPSIEIINFYGTTETPQAMAYHRIEPQDDLTAIPIGRGIDDVQLLVLTPELNLSDFNAVGEIYIRTKYLSQGYFNDGALTSASFIASPFSEDKEDKLYRTGDCGFYRRDGAVIITGRLDDQVKIRGFRIELAEVTNALQHHPLINQACVLAKTLENNENSLIAYIVLNTPSQDKPTQLLKSALSEQLAAYMLPARFIYIDSLPLLPNGKLDRAALLQLSVLPSDNEIQTYDNPVLAQLINDWQRILSLPHIAPQDSFVQLGGDSLSFIEASIIVEKRLGGLVDNWEKLPLERLASQQKTQSRTWFHKIYSTVLIRAIAIVLVVLDHFELVKILGSTDALFIVAGWSFASYQLNSVLQKNSLLPLFKTLTTLILPVFLYTAFLQAAFFGLNWQDLFLIGNFSAANLGGGSNFWFIDIFVQLYLILAGVFFWQPIRYYAAKSPYYFALSFLMLAVLLAIGLHSVWNTEYLFNRVPQMKLWLFALGMTIVYATKRWQQFILVLLSLLFYSSGYFSDFALLASVFILFVKRITLPNLLAYAINATAAASLFIYLTHFQFKSLITHTPLANNMWLCTLVAVIGGCLVWQGWQVFIAQVLLINQRYLSRWQR